MNTKRLSLEVCKDLGAAVSRAAPKIRFWYVLKNSWGFLINKTDIEEQTKAVSDHEKLYGVDSIFKKEHSSKKVRLYFSKNKKSFVNGLFGLKIVEICVYNPLNHLPEISVGKRTAPLVRIDGLSFSNDCDARVDFKKNEAFLNEEDQDLAHNLGFMYTPAKIKNLDSLSSSDFELHKNKPVFDERGKKILYCDNSSCQKIVKNPVLVVDIQTGGLYHSDVCFKKDMIVKKYLAQEIKDINLKPQPVFVSLEDALNMYERNELQQSQKPKNVYKFRDLKLWPEAAVLFDF